MAETASNESQKSSESQHVSFIPRKTAPNGKEVIDAQQLSELLLRTKPDLIDGVLNTFFRFYEECLLMENVKTEDEANEFPLDLVQVGQAYFAFSVKSIGGWIDAFGCFKKYKDAKKKEPEQEELKTEASLPNTTP